MSALGENVCRCLGMKCDSERIGCRRCLERDIDPLRTPWASTLRPHPLPPALPCPKRIPTAPTPERI